MPIPPNFRKADLTVPIGLWKRCHECKSIRHEPRFICVKYMAFVLLDDVCDSFDSLENYRYPQNLIPDLTEEEKKAIERGDVLDLQG